MGILSPAADYCHDAMRRRMIAVCENHEPEGQPTNTISAIDLQSGEVTVLCSGCDFYSSPALNSDGSEISWIQWNHPNMPWDETELMLASLTPSGQVQNVRCIAGGTETSVQQPQFCPKTHRLYFISDRSGWWNFYYYCKDADKNKDHEGEVSAEASCSICFGSQCDAVSIPTPPLPGLWC